MRSVRRATTAVLLCAVALVLPIAVSGCGGGHGNGAPSQITVTISNCDTTTYASFGVICFDFSVTGPAGTFDLLPQFIGGAGQAVEGAYEIPPGLAAQLPGLNPPSNVHNLVLSFDGQTITGRFCWFAGADLGFVAAMGMQFFLTPVDVGTTNPLGPVADGCGSLSYLGGGQSEAGVGPAIGALNGRAGHCGTNVGGKNIALAGGFGLNGANVNSYATVDRFNIDTSTFTYTHPTSLTMRNARSDQACSFFLDPVTEGIKVLVTGGFDIGSGATDAFTTADVYCFTPEMIASTANNMNVMRRGHTATWIPSNRVLIIGGETGATGGTTTLNSIEIYDPTSDTFQLLTSPSLNFARRGHTATLLPSGKVLIAGGFDTASPSTPLPAELLDPATLTVMTVPVAVVDRVDHTATRLANGWVLLAGGKTVSSAQTTISSSSQIFQPELGTMGQFTLTMPLMTSPRAFHAASLLGDGNALVTGGEIAAGPVVTQSAELFLYHTLTFTPVIPMTTARAEHSSDPTDCGTIVLSGGRGNGVNNFLSTLELFPFRNMNPVVTTAFTSASGLSGTMFIDITVTDEDADGGYVIIRYRPGGLGAFRLATIDQQNPSTAGGAFPNMQVGGMPAQALPYAFRWNFAADGLTTGQIVQIEVLPVGVTLGTPVHFTFALP